MNVALWLFRRFGMPDPPTSEEAIAEAQAVIGSLMALLAPDPEPPEAT